MAMHVGESANKARQTGGSQDRTARVAANEQTLAGNPFKAARSSGLLCYLAPRAVILCQAITLVELMAGGAVAPVRAERPLTPALSGNRIGVRTPELSERGKAAGGGKRDNWRSGERLCGSDQQPEV
ncbi:hypothetical protein AAFF_G00413160 [Aldrovandia affinis]|uniref:Uncharacterized protein n=1 Tax=Aldrovandia affinis TaxID=143900 RepID=A0AAD7SBI5_9TELE|nr:hypothetical protein AAFF_G00413160 [Aldrovandia affinis]